MKEQLIASFGGAKPSVCKYHDFLKGLPLDERGVFCKMTYGVALSEWGSLTSVYRLFLVRLIKSERQCFVDYVRKETVLGQLLYEPVELNLLLKVFNLLEQPCKNNKSSYTELSFSLLLSFDIDLSVKYLSDKIRYSKADSFDFVELMEKSSEME